MYFVTVSLHYFYFLTTLGYSAKVRSIKDGCKEGIPVLSNWLGDPGIILEELCHLVPGHTTSQYFIMNVFTIKLNIMNTEKKSCPLITQDIEIEMQLN